MYWYVNGKTINNALFGSYETSQNDGSAVSSSFYEVFLKKGDIISGIGPGRLIISVYPLK